ncbi:MAG: cyclic 2,3-diphosphoglycerate synthase [Rhodospirillales bacterium]|nr:cyclic 2,3-diphosphoglycerate synthase [Rhodospirillales bacterium]
MIPKALKVRALAEQKTRRRIVILGAAGRDFHNFNVVYRNDPKARVVAFTATQIPGIGGRRYPPILAGELYPDGIPIEEETDLEALCRRERVHEVVFAYSDVPHAHVMHLASRALAAGADFRLLGPDSTMLNSSRPVVSVTAIRTGCGKSQTARWLAGHLGRRGLRVAALRHPMPYGDLEKERVQRFASRADLDQADCTVEEREEYEPYIALGHVIFAGVDYAAILAAAEEEADLILWDGGNNDFSFIRPDLSIVLADALRPGQAASHYPGEAVLRMADVVVVNKVNSAPDAQVAAVVREVRAINSRAPLIRAASAVRLEDPDAVRDKRVLVVEDGPTITHGGMAHGAGFVAASACEGVTIVDPRDSAAPGIRAVFDSFPHIGRVLPALGYGAAQLAALAETINRAEADVVVSGTPADISALAELNKPVVRARYEFADAGEPTLAGLVDRWLDERGIARGGSGPGTKAED